MIGSIFTFDLEDGLASGECPVCWAVALADRRWVESFWREGRQDPATRRRFVEARGFCRHHAWLLHDSATRADASYAVADLYGSLADRDLEALERRARGRVRRRRPAVPAAHGRPCPACEEAVDSLERRVEFLLELVATPAGWEAYVRSAGLCLPHLALAVSAAGEREALAHALVEDASARLAATRARLAELDRKRDHRFADEPKGLEQGAPAEIVARYVGLRAD